MSVKEFKLPDPGEGLTEAEIVTWNVKVGDTVKVNDIVVEIETAKSLVELPVPFAGTVTALHVSEGDTVEVGTPIISVETAGGAAPVQDAPAAGAVEPGIEGSPAPKMAAAAAAAEEEEIEEGKIGGTTSTGRTAVLVGYGVKQTEAVRRPRKGAPAAAAPAATAPAAAPAAVAPAAQPKFTPPAQERVAPVVREGGARALAKPPVRKYAKDLGVDLAAVAGSGEGGIISRADVDAHANGAAAATEAPSSATSGTRAAPAAYQAPVFTRGGERETRVPIKGVRKMTAQAMVGSAFTAPHVTEWVTIDATATMELVERLKKDREFKDVKVTPLLVLAKAMAVAIRRHPEINATWDEAAQEIVVKHYVNLGIAAATPRGLIVPNIKDADQMSMLQLAEAIGALTATAREGRTQPADMSGGTITITNVGVFGVDTGTPIINPGESAIMAFGAIRRQPWVVTAADGTETIEPRWVTQLALSFDHRLVDGELGSKFIADVGAILADPARGLVWG
ncbi:branched-chain alpha-keto acid dehydrogenase subunit E2 [Phycicoccus sp. Root563]|uniref:dihydrolipoamide acetyltransferase family protein n=1 Tax=unclassified Phycicoccus TaxID=2637926 RepID=UPI000703A014|nr:MULTISPECIES: dihydrolipoamide acetyltransferase family protein [unclassified Phycicoccus]KQU65159.1 branched-chain alpha-keto acid dehydrogenase subunit E2 [Phycicoccus sp. Root101]KQZ89712.1 branched-chain alpha-keto acid dehydrogenase subunit E2 [Phycicoccus sp. Root563]